jgi:hypothetical protein
MENLRRAVITGRFTEKDVARFMHGAKMQLSSGGGVARLAAGGRPSPVPVDGLYRGLNQAVTSPSSYRFAYSGRAGTAKAGSGVQIGTINITNPVQELAGESLYRTVRRLALEFEG